MSVPVIVDYHTAYLIRRAFLPSNPNKMRSAAPQVIEAARTFIEAVESSSMNSIEWQAVLDAMAFTENNSGLVSDAHLRARKIIETAIYKKEV